MRDVEEEHTLVLVLSAVLRVQKTRLTNESVVSSPCNRRISAYVRVEMLGSLRRTTVCWAGKTALT